MTSTGLVGADFDHLKSAIDEAAIVAITDVEGTITYANQKFCKISKYRLDELVGQNHRVINSGFHSKAFFVEMWKTIVSGKTWEGEILNRAKDDSLYWVHTTIVPFMDKQGRPERYVSVRFDITQRKQMESQVIQQDRLASLGLLASSLAHEIGTPLGVIRGRAEFLSHQLTGQDSATKTLDIIIQQIDRVSKLIQSLLHIARGKETVTTEPVNVKDVFANVSNLISYEISRKNILLKMDCPDRLLVKAGAEALGQVFLNLFVNSVHAIETARQSGRTENHMLHFSAKAEGEKVLLKFEDTGCGISEANMKNLFKPFFTTKDIGKGTGLGLATSYRLVESWGGTISALSKEDTYTIFQISLTKA